jgi:hypothetical protein
VLNHGGRASASVGCCGQPSWRLHARRQQADGTWWYEVAIHVPVAAVQPIDGQDYSGVPTERAEPRYVLDNGLPPLNGRPRLELHTVGCPIIDRRLGARITPVPNAKMARDALGFADTTACDMCRPEP